MPKSKDQPANASEPEKSSWFDTIVVVVGALIVALLVQQFLIKPYKVPSGSMLPTVDIGQRILADRIGDRFGDPKDGQIIVFHPPSQTETAAPCSGQITDTQPCITPGQGKLGKAYVKRVVGVPGERIQVVHGHVIRNGKAVDEPYARTCDSQLCNTDPFVVPPGTYFMMGDNRGDSLDSRFWGPLPRKNVIGRAVATYWPPKKIGGV